MSGSGITAIIILCIAVILFVINKIPMCVVAVGAGAAMACAGVIETGDIFAGLSNSAVLYLIGMGIVSQVLINAGLIEHIKTLFLKLGKNSEKTMILIFIVVFALVSMLFQGIVIMLMIMPVICAMEKSTDGEISRKQMYMPLGIASLFGGNLSIIGSSSMLNAVKQAEAFSGQEISFFAPFWLGVTAVCTLFLIYATVGCTLQRKVFTFEPPAVTYQDNTVSEAANMSRQKKNIAYIISAVCVAGFLSGIDVGYISMAAAALLIVFRCIRLSDAIKSVDWAVVFTVTGSIAIGKGIEQSGAGLYIAEKTVMMAGSLGKSPFAMCVIMIVISSLLSNFMSNNAAVTISVPIGMSIALQLGVNPAIYAIACGTGANLSVATPIATTVTAVITSAGYRFRDYLIAGGFINIVTLITVSVALKLIYFM